MSNYRDYPIRCIEADWSLAIRLLQILGMLDVDEQPTDECAVWHVIWYNLIPTGQFVTDGVTGEPVAVNAPETDANGNPYVLANLTTKIDLAARAESLAGEHPELADALRDLSRFFPVDEHGQPRQPKHPVCVRAGQRQNVSDGETR